MEMSFGPTGGSRPVGRRQSQRRRAQWWFSRMRQVVDRAIDWEPVAPARPEQTWLPNTYRQIGVVDGHSTVAVANPEERQICA